MARAHAAVDPGFLAAVRRIREICPKDSVLSLTAQEALDLRMINGLVASRADLKSDLLKELDKHKAQFNGYRGSPGLGFFCRARMDAGEHFGKIVLTM